MEYPPPYSPYQGNGGFFESQKTDEVGHKAVFLQKVIIGLAVKLSLLIL
jgi:hypothetical protein